MTDHISPDEKARLKAEIKQEKKIKRLLKKSAWAAGIGIGLLLLKLVVTPFIGEHEDAQKALGIFAWCMVAYGGVIILSFVFLKKFLFRINFVLSYAVMPLILIKLIMDAF